MNLVTELHKTAKHNYEIKIRDAQGILDSVKANLEMEDEKDVDMLKYFGTLKVIPYQKEKIEISTKIIEEGYLTQKDIKSICLTYHLRFLSSSLYKKEIPLVVLNDLRIFIERNGITLSPLSDRLMIIAPADHFTLGKRPKADPVLLYRYDYDYYKIISKWGNDFTPLRAIKGAISQHPNKSFFFSLVFMVNAIITFFVIENNANPMFYFLNLVLVIVLMVMITSDEKITSSEDYWNKPYKQ